MPSFVKAALFALAYYGALGVLCAFALPRIWRPAIPFGVPVRAGQVGEVSRILRYFRRRIFALTVATIGLALLIAAFKPVAVYFHVLSFPFLFATLYFLMRARGMVAPSASPPRKAVASVRRRHYRDYVSPWCEVLPITFLALLIAASVYGHVSLRDRWVSVSLGFIPIGVFGYFWALLPSILIVGAKQPLGETAPAVVLAASNVFRKAALRFLYGQRLFLMAGLAAVVLFMGPARTYFRSLPFWIICGVFAVAFVVLGIGQWLVFTRYGVEGWRWAVRRGLVPPGQAPVIFAADSTEGGRWILGMLYYNPADPAVVVPARVGAHWTVNLGNIWGKLLIVSIPLSIIIAVGMCYLVAWLAWPK